jgi:hypothetical protein
MPASKIGLLIVTLFLIISGIYLLLNKKEISGGYYGESGWVYNSLSGVFVLCLGIGSLALLIFVIKKRKL